MDEQIRENKPEPSSEHITNRIPAQDHDSEVNPFKLPGKRMGPASRTIMWVGFLTILALGLAMGTDLKHPVIGVAFCLAVPVYFAWLACWIGYK